MTASTIALSELAEKGADVDMLRQMVQFMAPRLMEIDVEGRCGAGYDEKSAERTNSRNGFRDRTWETRAGAVELNIPKLRQGSYFPEFLEPRRTAEKALTAVIQEAYKRHLHALRGRPGQGNGHERRLQEPGLAAVRRARRASRYLPQSSAGRRLAIPLDRRHVRQDARGRPHRDAWR